MSKNKHKQEEAICSVCGKNFKRSMVYMPCFRKPTCSGKCRLIAWALKEANKVMVKK